MPNVNELLHMPHSIQRGPHCVDCGEPIFVPYANIAISCQCGWVGITPTYADSTAAHLVHQLFKGEGHSALNHTNVAERMGNAEFSILRQVAHQDSLDYRAKQQVKGRDEYRLRRKEDSPLYVETVDDGLGCARGLVSALAIMATGLIVALCVWAVWIR